MQTTELFLDADAALRSVIDRISPDDLDRPAPASWSSKPDPTVRDILQSHAYDEAWVPDVLAGKSVSDGDDLRNQDLLRGDPITAYDSLNDMATAAVRKGVDPDAVFHFQYGDYPASEGLVHLAVYRGFQAWLIAKHLGIPFNLTPRLVAGFTEHVLPHVEEWRAMGVFPPEIEPPIDADDQTKLLCAVGYWVP